MPDGSDWKRVDALLDEALDVPAAERERWLEARCAGDEALRRRLQELLRYAEDDLDGLETAGALVEAVTSELGVSLGSRRRAPALRAGQRLGRYEIRGLLGSGGMSRVYRALDPSLGREVAIKALAEAFRDDAASLRRFEREARALANVNHPNVATIHGFELLEGAPYLVLELVDGETLEERLRPGPLPLREAVEVARQVAEALEEAHRKGVVHRDLKPSNVMIGPGGRVKVLDFGVAKAVPRRDGDATQTATAPGEILGTAPYMSPEQVRGDEVDARTDVWGFGCLLYEMLCGRRAFPGRSIPDVLAAVLRDEVDWSLLPESTPTAVRRLLERCLRKDRHQRLQDVGDARLELAELDDTPAAATAPSRPRTRDRRTWAPWIVAGIGFALSGAILLSGPGRAAAPAAPPVRLSLELPSGFALADDYASPFAIAPDGSRLALVGKRSEREPRRLFLRDLGALEIEPIEGTDGAWQPFFSSDGRQLAFFADRKLRIATLDGRSVVPVADVGGNPRGGSFAPDGSVVLAPNQASGLVRVSEGTAPVPVTTLAEGERSHRWPQVLPGGRWVLFTVAPEDATYDEAWLEVVSLETGARKRVASGSGSQGRYVEGHILFARGGRLHSLPFDVARMEARGAELALEGVRYDPTNGGAHFAASESGALVYSPGTPTTIEHFLSWVDSEGHLKRVLDTPRIFRQPRLGPDRTRVALVVGPVTRAELWFLDMGSGTLSPSGLAKEPHRPTWQPDGRRLSVGVEDAGRWRIVTVPADGAGPAVTLLESANRLYPNAWSPDGRRLVYQERLPDTGWDLGVLEVDASGRRAGEPRPLSNTRFQEANASISADGRWVAYESDELDGVIEVYVRSFPDGAGKVRASTTGARWPRWGSGHDLFYWYSFVGRMQRIEGRVEGDRFVAARVAPVWPAGAAEDTLLGRLVVSPTYASYDLDAPTGRFLMLEKAAQAHEEPFRQPVVIPNWAAGLRSPRP